MMQWVELITKLATIVATLVAAVGVIVAVHSYRTSVRLKRAEWLQKLYQQFYESDRYKEISCILDYRPEKEISDLHARLVDLTRDDLADKLWEYLNFFEFVAGLLKLKQITEEDLNLLFQYPLQNIAADEKIMATLHSEGFEYLHAFMCKAHGLQ
jgi:hypothetical protein